MAQDTKPDTTASTSQEDDDNYHYYSGGEIKELANTQMAPALLIFYGILLTILAAWAIWYFTTGRYSVQNTWGQPVGLTAAGRAAMQNDLAQVLPGYQAANTLNINNVLLPEGSPRTPQAVDKAIDDGTTVYTTYCIGCHGQNQDGNGVNAASLNPKPRNLRDAPFMQAMSYQRIYTSVHKGVPGTAMPRWENSLTETQMRNAIVYVLSLSDPDRKKYAELESTSGAGSSPATTSDTGSAATSATTPATTSATSAASGAASLQPATGTTATSPNGNTAPATTPGH